ncbi:hypothetical protein ACFPOB_20620 [Bosea eneae]|uniref:Uncharacterized protein n=1 Tax=Bosea eneae TaxID=151454 RepID=A0ABW0IXI6_9HYPH
MNVLVDIEFGIIARTFRAACDTAAAMGIPKSGWFHATPESLLGRSNALIIEGGGAAEYPRLAEVEKLRRGCDIVRDDRIARAMERTVRARVMIVAAPRKSRFARLQARLSAAWAGLMS